MKTVQDINVNQCCLFSSKYSSDFTDTGQTKNGQNNNGYVPNITDYSPSNQTALMLRSGANSSSSTTETSYHPNGQVPSVNSTLTRNSGRSSGIDTRQDNGLPNVHGSFNSLQNTLISKFWFLFLFRFTLSISFSATV